MNSMDGIKLFGLAVSLCISLQTQAVTVKVVDSNGLAISGARVLVGQAAGSPFSSNMVTTDSQGQADIPATWTTSEPVTADAPGYIRKTWLSQSPHALNLTLNTLKGAQVMNVEGAPTGYQNPGAGGMVDMSIVIPTIARKDLYSLSIDDLISQDVDTLDLLGKTFYVPSNFAVPYQEESYSIFNVTLNKPNYHFPFRVAGNYQLVALHGQFPFKKVADELRGGTKITEIFNDVRFWSAGKRAVTVSGPSTHLDIPISEQSFNSASWVQAPQLPAGTTLVSVMLNEQDGGLYPTDLKSFKSGEKRTVYGPGGTNTLTASLITPTHSLASVNRFQGIQKLGAGAQNQVRSMTVLRTLVGATIQPSFLAFVAAPKIDGDKILLTPPAPAAGSAAVQPKSTLVSLEVVEPYKNGLGDQEKVTRVWEFVGDTWPAQIEPPQVPLDGSIKPNRWTSVFVGTNPQIVDSEYVTQNALDF